MKYKILNDDENKPVSILKIIDKATATIPMVEANTDYQEYLEWIAAGNEPEPAD